MNMVILGTRVTAITYTYMYIRTSIHIYIYIYICVEVCMWHIRIKTEAIKIHKSTLRYASTAAPQKHQACNRPLSATRLETESGGLATRPPCDKSIECYSTLHRGPRQGFVKEGPRHRHVTARGGGDRDKPQFRVTAMYMYIYIYICICICVWV